MQADCCHANTMKGAYVIKSKLLKGGYIGDYIGLRAYYLGFRA